MDKQKSAIIGTRSCGELRQGGLILKTRSIFLPRAFLVGILAAGMAAGSSSCSSKQGNGDGENEIQAVPIPATSKDYIVLAWNDLGMHCLNPTYDKAVILPPYNTVWAQVVRRGDPPKIVTAGLSVKYSIVNNSYSYGKRDYGQFWDFCVQLFGTTLAHDTGLNLDDPNVHNGLSGLMVSKTDHFQVSGIPLTPVDDAGAWNPYQVVEIVVSDVSSGAELARTKATVPTSDEIHCDRCHGQDALLDVLTKHDERQGTKLVAQRPILCASCHGSPVLGLSGPGSSGRYLSGAIHSFHASRGAACYDCHPGPTTQCSRSTAHSAADGNCQNCHGSLDAVGNSVLSGTRVPWVDEPKCATCHPGVAEVDTGSALYRNATGHGGLSCPACHGSPHAMIPSKQASDNVLASQYQTSVKSLGSCGACHGNSKGEGLGEFLEAHGGTRATACSVCHTAVRTNNAAQWPHQFQWKAR